jgi:hypothetical protein
MQKLTEQDINSQFIGRLISAEALKKCAHKNGPAKEPEEYIVYSCGFLYKQDLREAFGVTDKLKDLWERRGTEFNVYLHVSDGVLTAANILKYTESGGARPSMTTPKCTQQELRIARRILDYITA